MVLSLKAKLFSLVGFCLLALATLGGLGIFSTTQLSRTLQDVVATDIPVVRNLGLIDMVHDGLRGNVVEAYLGFETKDEAKIASALESIQEHKKNVIQYFEELDKLGLEGEVKSATQIANSDMTAYLSAALEFAQLPGDTGKDVVEQKWQRFSESFDKLEKSLGELGELAEKSSQEKNQKELEKAENFNLLSWILAALLFPLILGTSWFVTGRVSKNLRVLTLGLGKSSGSVNSSVQQVSSAAQEVMSAVNQQASSLQQTSAALEEISAMVAKSSERSVEVAKTTEHSREVANHGQEVMKRLDESMRRLKEANGSSALELSESNKKIASILDIIKEVATKTRVINDIVFQTKLLSFNASVEAARAGESGKGFSVVAEEVGNLAQMSGQAAKEINDLLDRCMSQVSEAVQESTKKVDQMIGVSTKLVEDGLRITDDCAQALNDIVQSTNLVSEMVVEISTGSQESSKGVTEITRAIQEIDSASQTTARSAEICIKSTNEMAFEVKNLNSVAEELDKNIEGGNSKSDLTSITTQNQKNEGTMAA